MIVFPNRKSPGGHGYGYTRNRNKCNFSAEFLILPEMNSVILGMPVFEENDIKVGAIRMKHDGLKV